MDTVFFIASKVVWALLSPLNFMIFMALAGVLLAWRGWRLGHWLAGTGFGLLLLNMAYPFGDLMIQPLESRFERPHPLPQKIDGIIQLGGGEQLGRSLSWQTPLIGEGGDRYIATAWLARQYKDIPVYFSGGSGSVQLQNEGKESHIARQLLSQLGIAPERLYIEPNSRNTWENFKNLKALLKPDGRYLLVTSAFHMPRSVGIARKLGIEVIPYPTDYRSHTSSYRKVDFDFFDHLKSLEPAWKEWIGLTVYYLSGKTSEWLPAPGSSSSRP